jgi:hypothetical protein
MGTRTTVAGLTVAALLASGCAGDTVTSLEQAVDECGTSAAYIYTADEGRTMIIDHEGEEDAGGASIDELVCVLAMLESPTSVTTQMDSTRALDGRQSASWDVYTATWSYHPDTGVDVIITEN